MRYIKKNLPPSSFSQFLQSYRKQTGRTPIYKTLNGRRYRRVKKKLKAALLKEQYGLCCYCLKRLERGNAHIEHFRPQSKYPDLVLDYQNLFASCNGLYDDYENCGHKKADFADEELLISPLEADCADHFAYAPNGEIFSLDARGERTVSVLKLDSYLLTQARKTAIEWSGLFDDDFEERKDEFIQMYQTPYQGRLEAFCEAIIYCMKHT